MEVRIKRNIVLCMCCFGSLFIGLGQEETQPIEVPQEEVPNIEDGDVVPYDPDTDDTEYEFIRDDDDLEDDFEVEQYEFPIRELGELDFETIGFNPYEQEEFQNDTDYINRLFDETLVKVGGLIFQMIAPETTFTISRQLLFTPLIAVPNARENTQFADPYKTHINSLLPNADAEGSTIDNLFSDEMLRDITQGIEYYLMAQNYGLSMVVNNQEVMDGISPERLYNREEILAENGGVIDGFEGLEDLLLEEDLYNGMTDQQFINAMFNVITEVENAEFTGDANGDAALLNEAIGDIVGEEDREDVETMILSVFNDAQYTDALTDEELGGIIEVVVDAQWEDIATLGVNRFLTEDVIEGLTNRDVVERYGGVAVPYIQEYERERAESTDDAVELLLQGIELWQEVQQGRYLETYNQMQALGENILNNGDDYVDRMGELEIGGEVYEQLKRVYEIIGN